MDRWVNLPRFSRHFLKRAQNQADDDIALGVTATLSVEPTGAQKCLRLDPNLPD